MLARVGEEGADLVDVARADDDLGDEPVDGRVDAAREAVDRAREDAVFGEDARETGDAVGGQGPATVTATSWTVPPTFTVTVAELRVVRRSRVRPPESVSRTLLAE